MPLPHIIIFLLSLPTVTLAGAQKVAAGLTTIEEVLRVTPHSQQK